jgi:ATP-dependent helicase HrpB
MRHCVATEHRSSAKIMLPIEDVLETLCAALEAREAAVLVAPPGAGKTTRVPLALLSAPWRGDGRIVVLEPRRLAARAAAARMAETLGEAVGERVGFRVRGQARVSARTRVEVVTEGVFTRMILDDPSLDGVAAVLFDEFHERSLNADLGLALAREAQGVLREDLRLLVMSATLDGAQVSALLGEAPVVESEGRAFPVETRYFGRDPAAPLEAQVEQAIRTALAEEPGSVLVFLPGAAEIRRVEALLNTRLRDRTDILVAPLYGALDPEAQDRAIAPAPSGVRKVVLATSIAETSLTIQGVRVVVDCGLARVPRFDPASGLTRLQTVRVSRAAADQRRGRAGRTEPGACYRLWDEAETRALAPFARPEILDSDLSGFALDLAVWGVRDSAGLALLDPPPSGAFSEARALLARLGALDAAGALTEHGKRLARLPLPPRLGHLVLEGARRGQAPRAARIAAILSERGVGGEGADLAERLERLAHDRGGHNRDALTLADRWAASARQAVSADGVSDGVLLAHAYPERIAQARGEAGAYVLASGRGVRLEPSDRLAREAFLAIGELGGGDRRDRVLLAAPITADEIAAHFPVEPRLDVEVDTAGRAAVWSTRRLGAVRLDTRRVERPSPEVLRDALLAHVRTCGLDLLPWSEGAGRLRARVGFMRQLEGEPWPDLGDDALLAIAQDWLAPLLEGRSSLASLAPDDIAAALGNLIPYELRRRLDQEAPEHFEAPTGTRASIDYTAEGGPQVDIRVQELFGLAEHPKVGRGRIPLTLALLSPARRPVQVTRDLPGFWRGSWQAVRSDMRGRYPKHPWPDDPLSAPPTTRAKPRGT